MPLENSSVTILHPENQLMDLEFYTKFMALVKTVWDIVTSPDLSGSRLPGEPFSLEFLLRGEKTSNQAGVQIKPSRL